MKFEEDVVSFYKENKKILSEYHNRPIYVTLSIHDVKLRGGLVDPVFPLDIVSLSTLETMEIPPDQVVEETTEILLDSLGSYLERGG